ncbi:MAG: hypothetical protein OP8BY_1775 [Candidatus Saccharicenans subterraneus]|uniref:Uncharacterized protein n=1 Tax=Candidatus Saccharicenans subterraneus TaxID=2508984 RepID=A0A3E2BN69_9BACT|nr:MAG: hypothetical protein OP8BY_1775 [Candidatus Saccharicenans subterraneum]
MKRTLVPALMLSLIISGLFFPACKKMSTEELKNSMEIIDVETKWVSKEYRAWPPKLVLVPVISFRVKNISDKPLTYVNFNAIFKFKDEAKNLGDNFLAAIRKKPVMPGEVSQVITLKSNYGVEGKTLDSFKNNPYWKPVVVKLFARSFGSEFVLLGEWEVSKTIDFKEDQAVTPVVEKKEDVKK